MNGGELVTDLEAELASLRKQVADGNAERIRIESALIDALGALQFYANEKSYFTIVERQEPDGYEVTAVNKDAGKRARVTLNRIFERSSDMPRVQALKPIEDGTNGCDVCERT
jgi:hypothetical protein